MRASRADRIQLALLRNAPLLLFVAVFVLFGALESSFLRPETVELVLYQAAFTGILAVGMTFVLLTAGIDLSVGATMYLAAVIMGELLGLGSPLLLALLLCLAVGAVVGLVNGVLIARVGVVAHLVLTRTTFGRQMYAVGNDAEAAAKSGIRTKRVLLLAYLICGLCAGLATLVAAGQLGDASPGFGEQKEFDAIAAAVLGGTSLFGGRGSVFPGTVVGTLLIQTVAAGLVFTRVDIYYLDMVTALTIFVAVLLDALRTAKLASLQRRFIRADTPRTAPPTRRAVAEVV